VKDVIAAAKQNPDKLNYASSGNGTPGHVGFELFKFMTGITVTHVPYKGGAAGIADLMAGRVQLMMESTNSITPFARAGKVRGLAVTGPKRSVALPEIPTLAEAGVTGYEATTWTGIVAPVGTPSRRPAERRAAADRRGPDVQGEGQRDRLRAHERNARAVRGVHPQREREVGRCDQALRRQDRLSRKR
jgi:tripartite-type tricarboxylate transporter receptor subunit TctC